MPTYFFLRCSKCAYVWRSPLLAQGIKPLVCPRCKTRFDDTRTEPPHTWSQDFDSYTDVRKYLIKANEAESKALSWKEFKKQFVEGS